MIPKRNKFLVAFQYVCLALAFIGLGAAADRLFTPQPPFIAMPIRLVDADMARLLVLQERGGIYTRFAKLDGTSGIVAVRQKDGTWIVPCFEVGKVIGGKR